MSEIRSGGEVLASRKATGDTLKLRLAQDWVGKTLTVMALGSTPPALISVTTRVIETEITPGSASHRDILRRSDWNAATDLPRLGLLVGRARRTEVFIHHTAVLGHGPARNEWETLDEIGTETRALQTPRSEDLGLDIPYSMVAFCMSNGDLILCEERGLHRSGAHTRRHNSSALGIAFHGNFETLPLPTHFDEQLTTLGNFLRDLRVNNGFFNLGTQRPLDREVFANRDVMATACPGDHLYAKLNLIRLP